MEQRGHRKTREGKVVSNKMDKTIVVEIERLVTHPLYKKIVRRRKRLVAHVEAEQKCQIGDVVRIEETRPLSKRKRWRYVETLRHAQ
jgi:small subunit ribosomal protein S17